MVDYRHIGTIQEEGGVVAIFVFDLLYRLHLAKLYFHTSLNFKINPMEDCKYFESCSQNICPLDPQLESRVGYRGENCCEFPRIKHLVKKDRLKVYIDVLDKLKPLKWLN